MSLSNDLAVATARSRDLTPWLNACKACRVLETLTGDDKTDVESALAGIIGAEKLARIFAAHGIDIGRRTIFTHRRHLEGTA